MAEQYGIPDHKTSVLYMRISKNPLIAGWCKPVAVIDANFAVARQLGAALDVTAIFASLAELIATNLVDSIQGVVTKGLEARKL